MTWLLRWPLRYLLLGVLGVFALLACTGTYLLSVTLVSTQVERQAIPALRAELHRLQGGLQSLLGAGHLEDARTMVAAWGATPGHALTLVTAADGRILAATWPAMLDTPWTAWASELDPALLAHLAAAGGATVHLAQDGDRLSGYVTVCGSAVSDASQPTPCGFFYTLQHLALSKAVAVRALRLQTLAYGGALVLIAVALWWGAQALVGHRIERLLATAQQWATGDLTARTGLSGQEELARVGQALDTMAQTLAASQHGLTTANQQLAQALGERQQAEAALREREARMRAVVETAVEGIITIDAAGLIETYNPAAERLFGYPAVEVVGQNVSMLMPDPYRDEHDAYLARYLKTGVRQIIGIGREVVGRRRDGSTFPMALAVSEMRVGDRRMFTGLVSDITTRTQAEAALRQAHDVLEQRVQERTAALAEANEEVKRFAYLVSHDLRAPLVNLKGFAGELRLSHEVLGGALADVLPHLAPQQAAEVQRVLAQDIPEALDFMNASVTRMDTLIRAVLHLSRVGHRELAITWIDMAVVAQETLQTLAHQLAQRQVQITVGALPQVRVDRTAMAQVLGNLLSNAVHYLEPGRPGEITMTGERQAHGTVFTVRDNGRGIAQEDMPAVFEPFRRVGRQDVPGEGMGLAYVRALVRRHGGEITCESTLGVGTTFTFTIAHHLPEGVLHAG